MSRRRHLRSLREASPVILPSLLLCDFGNLEREVRALEAAGVRALHLDVMDGRFVPNLTYGMPLVEAFRRLTELPLDVHLMIAEPDRYIEEFHKAGADIITVHAEAVQDPVRTLTRIRELDCGAGIALNPGTALSEIEAYMDACDLILVMSVEAGFGGQSFQPVALEKLRALRQRLGDRVLLEVDGGVNKETVTDCVEAGAEMLVVGSAIFRQAAYGPAVSMLSDLASLGKTRQKNSC